MAIHKSAKKRIRRTARVTTRKRARTSEMRTYIRKVDEAIKAGDVTAAEAALKVAQTKMQRSADKNVLRKKTAARKISRLSKQIKKLKGK